MSFYEEHGGVTDEDIEAFFRDNPAVRPLQPLNGADPSLPVQFHSGDGRPVPPQGGVEPNDPSAPLPLPAEGTTEGSPSETPSGAAQPDDEGQGETPPTDDFVEFGDVRVSRSQAEAAVNFQQHLAGDPQLQRLLSDYLAGGAAASEGGAPASAPADGEAAGATTLQPPPDLDLEDPAIRAIWGVVQQQQAQINDQLRQLHQGVQTTQAAQMAQFREQAEANFRRASENFRVQHELDQKDIDTLANVAARLGVVPQLMQGVDPLTGLPTSRDPLQAVDRALEIAMYMVPEYRDREFRRSVQAQRNEANRRKLLGAVGGSSGSVARTQPPPRPGTPEARSAMLAEVGAMLNGEWSDPTAN